IPPLLMLVALLLPVIHDPPARAAGDAAGATRAFHAWLEHELWPRARRAGITRRLFTRAFAGMRPRLDLPDLRRAGGGVPARQRQAEFGPPAAYFAERRLASLAREGRRLLRRHAALLRRIERRRGVPGPVLLAIWAKESHYGRAAIPHDALRILATQAWRGRRREMFAAETVAALKILQRGLIDRALLKSSWAGALGQPQMLPRRYLAHAVDFDGDGRSDIWRSVPDVLASIAAYLADAGWRRGLPWGWEVTLPANVSCALEGPDGGRPAEEWLAMGVRRVDGRPLPAPARRARLYLMLPAGRHGPAFLVTDNFYVLKAYNMSDLYALFVGHLADRIAGRARGPFRGRWGDVGHLLRADVARMQEVLVKAGHDVGGIDGLAGFRTRRAIGLWERRHGLRPGCFPTAALKRRMLR
ncbi:MAG TPA: lytic murein transglycosylase, partial [Thermopetrobacter sp.]|nr:lytic murein transglycosylase [Thermopetrobacter sp.]